MKHIGNLNFSEGSKTKKKRIGRGPGSGHGGTSTRGHKGQKSRKSYHHFRGFEGGQMPLARRVPKFGFNNRFEVKYQVVNVGTLQHLFEEEQITGKVDFDTLLSLGVISKSRLPLKILGNGELRAALNIEADHFSKSAKEKIESAGGSTEIRNEELGMRNLGG